MDPKLFRALLTQQCNFGMQQRQDVPSNVLAQLGPKAAAWVKQMQDNWAYIFWNFGCDIDTIDKLQANIGRVYCI